MAKELPYFKFYTDDWLLGRIMEMSASTRGHFITFCAQYWRRNCNVSEQFFRKNLPKVCQNLLESENILEVKNNRIYIKFLDEQYLEMSERQRVNRINASKGGKAKAKRSLKRSAEKRSAIKEVEVEVDKKINKKRTLLEYVKLTDQEHLKLIEKLGDKQLDDYLERLNNYIGSKGKRYKSHYYTILSWHRRDNPPKQKSLQSKLYKPIKK